MVNDGAGLSVGAMLYLVVDALEGANWQRTGKKSGRPKRLHQRLKDAVLERRRAERAELTPDQLFELLQADPALAQVQANDNDEEEDESD